MLHCVWSSTHVSSPPAHAVQEKIHFVVSLSSLSNDDRYFYKDVVLSAHEHTESRTAERILTAALKYMLVAVLITSQLI